MRILHGEVSSVADLSPEHRALVTVGPDEFRVAVDHKLVTERAGSDVVIAAQNEFTRTGLLGRFSVHSHELSEIPPPAGSANLHAGREQLQEALAGITELGPAQGTSVWLGGGAIAVQETSDSRDPAAMHFERAYVVGQVLSLGLPFAEVVQEWTHEPADKVSVELDAYTSTLMVDFRHHNLPEVYIDPSAT